MGGKILNEAPPGVWTARQTALSGILGEHRVIVGTPEQVAVNILEWIDTGAADGFNLQ